MTVTTRSSPFDSLVRRYRELRLMAQDSVLLIGLIIIGAFILAFIVWPLARVIVQGFFIADGKPDAGTFNLDQFTRYISPQFALQYWSIFRDTLLMGVLAATGSTALGFLFAYTVVRCNIPFKRVVHALTLLPTISPPFAIALAAILLFGRSGLVTKDILNIQFKPGVNDIYGMDGLVFVQIITFFSVAYLIIRGMLERIDPSMEEAALSLGASKWHIFRTITLPLLTPGIAASFLLMFVESLADLGNPVFIGGNVTVLSTQIWIAVNGEFNQQKGAALSLILLLPTLTVYILQRYWVSRKSYISVTGKPTGGGAGFVKEPLIRWTFIALTFLVLLLVFALYAAIFLGSITRLWGIDYTLDFTHYGRMFAAGLTAVLDTTFLAALATPIAGIAGMVIAFLVVRKTFSGKEALDFTSNLGGAVPGTILGIGYIIAFIQAPMPVVILIYVLLAYYLIAPSARGFISRTLVLLGGTLLGMLALFLNLNAKGRQPLLANAWIKPFEGLPILDMQTWLTMLAGVLIVLALCSLFLVERKSRRAIVILLVFMAVYLLSRQFIADFTQPLLIWGRGLGGDFWPRFAASLTKWINLFFQPPMAILGFTYTALSAFVVGRFAPRARVFVGLVLVAVSCAVTFWSEPLALVGSPYIILAAYAVRSLPTSVRAGVASLQQIDPAIEEASTNLGADASLTFRQITLPLILPAFLAGLIFSFARHMTSLSAIIFLSSPKWPILTALIMSEVEQGGTSVAAAYSFVLIVIVLVAIGLMYAIVGRAFRGEGIELSLGAG
ncbi:Molybdenum transport system permease protein ModB [Anaerolineae bacterium]|nr:Molybdenum transport system permease protein ModB [Anaerolineae bacterium]